MTCTDKPLISNKLFLIFTIIIVLAVSTALLYVFGHEHPLTTSPHSVDANTTSNATTIKDHTYKLVVKELKNILEEAKDIYLNALKKNET